MNKAELTNARARARARLAEIQRQLEALLEMDDESASFAEIEVIIKREQEASARLLKLQVQR